MQIWNFGHLVDICLELPIYHKVLNMTKVFMHQYFEIMALALQTLKSYHFAFGMCSLKHDMIRCSDFHTNFSLLV